MTDELASQPGALATRTDEQEENAPAAEPAVAPLDFRLNLKSRLAEPSEPLTTREHPLIRKLKWEHVVSDLPQEPSPIGATPVPLPPPPPVPPPPITSVPFEPPVSTPVAVTPSATAAEPAAPTRPSPPSPAPVAPVAPVVEPPHAVAAPVVADPEPTEAPSCRTRRPGVCRGRAGRRRRRRRRGRRGRVADVAPAAPAPVARSAEINRLSSVPDLILDDSPIEIPPITPSGGPIAAQQPAPVFAPVLPETMFVAAARPITSNVAALIAENAPSSSHARRKRKRHPFRTFFSFLVLLGLLGGGAYVARKYLLKKENHPTWSAELEPFATAVAATRGLEFKSAVDVQPITPDAYATRVASFVFPDQLGRAEAWRALGLLNGELDMAAIGHQAAIDQPAFYDPTTKTIYVSNDATPYEHLYRFALRRALAMALLDQQFDWSTRLRRSDARRGTRVAGDR